MLEIILATRAVCAPCIATIGANAATTTATHTSREDSSSAKRRPKGHLASERRDDCQREKFGERREEEEVFLDHRPLAKGKGPLLREAKRMVRQLNLAICRMTLVRNQLSLAHTLGERNGPNYLTAARQAEELLRRLRCVHLLPVNSEW